MLGHPNKQAVLVSVEPTDKAQEVNRAAQFCVFQQVLKNFCPDSGVPTLVQKVRAPVSAGTTQIFVTR